MRFVRERTVLQGKKYQDVDIIQYTTEQERRLPKKTRRSLTPEKMKKQNDKNRKRYVGQLINTNFTDADYRLDLTYMGWILPDREEAKRDVKRFLDRLRYMYKKYGAELKYIVVTEGGTPKVKGEGLTRVHHHLIINSAPGITRDMIEAKWDKGRRCCQHLQADEDGYGALAKYLLKSPASGQNEPDYIPSRNLKKPIETRNDNKYSHTDLRKMENAARAGELERYMERLYRGWKCVKAKVVHNKVTGTTNVYARMKKDRVTGNFPVKRQC